ncbi:hypothetical protein QCA50_005487 [Cerrena zonata]|uniref:Uncharacterized protein n=1 Tax=Cerrena zonata TaxID=2478898 RepID=A0AAW0GH22_9APHY
MADKFSKLFIVLGVFTMTAVALCPSSWWPGRFVDQAIGYGIANEGVQDIAKASNNLANCDLSPGTIRPCGECVKLTNPQGKECVFDAINLKCVDWPTKITNDFITKKNTDRCPTLEQIIDMKPSQVDLDAAHKEWDNIKKHVLDGDATDNTTGRHLFTTWQTVHKGESGICRTRTNLCSFMRDKPVHKNLWDDRPRDEKAQNRYTKEHVADICIGAILLHRKTPGTNPLSVSIQTGANGPICVSHRTGGSCYPNGIHGSHADLGTECKEGTGDGEMDDTVKETL